MERRTLSITGYGIYVVSIASLKRFLSIKNVKSKNILQVFQNNPDLYFESLSEGIWIPILPIDCIDYNIMVGSDEIAQGNWENVFAYDGFNLDVEDGEIWIGSIGSFANFKVSEFKKATSDRLSYQTLDGETLNKGFRITLEKANIVYLFRDISCILTTIKPFTATGSTSRKRLILQDITTLVKTRSTLLICRFIHNKPAE